MRAFKKNAFDNLPLGGAELDNYGYITKEKEDDNKRIFSVLQNYATSDVYII